MSYPRNKRYFEFDWGKKLRKTHVRDRSLTEGRIYPKAAFDRMPNVPKFRSVDWTHDMIIVNWHLLIWHERKLCALTNRPPAQSTRTGQLLSTLFHVNCSAAQVYILNPWQFTFALSCRRRSVCRYFFPYFKNFFAVGMMTNFVVKTCFTQDIKDISNLVEVKN